jgi:hypothetical protein
MQNSRLVSSWADNLAQENLDVTVKICPLWPNKGAAQACVQKEVVPWMVRVRLPVKLESRNG